ncbi:F0F1 ATP synthase subunit B [Mycoplasma sp. T363T]|uniref:ATP synthase subunit b n=1 Tax=Mycoplasma bradburyae TaxID=2963128 RepID=A0AAW6HNI9_9MOLU|nr:F0F1 ATP synthase subunit B [Mycoplasma bradburyae]MDC4163341.1 F0F1 ATP synthase subunit B [Mycoplasma bradburyae]MDC4181955.1 F0F1 ATP synthase subunit B [Mycoplasma bradburyae]MDC4182658.1 F0F1 ATP synthase subunit B [Mycoplasma bradburyae]MDC4183330.1 F0F1 ATP synthase subunit B [Mycoplasma bradburyae]UTS70380.1 F0F1 ATP synthase subunit B [Mycoplasma bradburyae]
MHSKRVTKLLLLSFNFLIISTIVSSCSIPDELKPSTIVNQFFPNFWVFIAHSIALIIIILLGIFFLWKPTKRLLTKRTEMIQAEINSANELKKQAMALLDDAKKEKQNAEIQAREIINLATNQAYSLKADVESDAKRKANRIIENAHSEIIKQESILKRELEGRIVDIALEATSTLIKKNVDKQDHERLVQELLKELD